MVLAVAGLGTVVANNDGASADRSSGNNGWGYEQLQDALGGQEGRDCPNKDGNGGGGEATPSESSSEL